MNIYRYKTNRKSVIVASFKKRGVVLSEIKKYIFYCKKYRKFLRCKRIKNIVN